MFRRLPLLLAGALLGGCGGDAEPAAGNADQEAKLRAAEAAFQADPSEENTIWLGRRQAYLGRYDEAVATFTAGLARFPRSHKLLRHRGHRHISRREFDLAVADLARAAELIEGLPDEVEPDGLPNAAGIPRSTSHGNIWYHLGLAHYLRGDFAAARGAYERCLEFSGNDDMLCATSHWLYMTLRRLGEDEAAAAVLAPVRENMEILENGAYHRLLLMYQGRLAPEDVWSEADSIDSASAGYGVGNWHLCSGQPERARAVFEALVADSPPAAFGHIAAEAELARMR